MQVRLHSTAVVFMALSAENIASSLWTCKRRRPTIYMAVVVIGLMAFIGLVMLSIQKPRFGKEKFELLSENMTEAEVVAVLGCPDGDYRPAIWKHPTWFVSPSDLFGLPEAERGRSIKEIEELDEQDVQKWLKNDRPVPFPLPRIYRKGWWARQSGIEIAFDAQGRVIHCTLWSLIPPRPPHDPIRWVRWLVSW